MRFLRLFRGSVEKRLEALERKMSPIGEDLNRIMLAQFTQDNSDGGVYSWLFHRRYNSPKVFRRILLEQDNTGD